MINNYIFYVIALIIGIAICVITIKVADHYVNTRSGASLTAEQEENNRKYHILSNKVYTLKISSQKALETLNDNNVDVLVKLDMAKFIITKITEL